MIKKKIQEQLIWFTEGFEAELSRVPFTKKHGG
jgi:hypothetical protein